MSRLVMLSFVSTVQFNIGVEGCHRKVFFTSSSWGSHRASSYISYVPWIPWYYEQHILIASAYEEPDRWAGKQVAHHKRADKIKCIVLNIIIYFYYCIYISLNLVELQHGGHQTTGCVTWGVKALCQCVCSNKQYNEMFHPAISRGKSCKVATNF